MKDWDVRINRRALSESQPRAAGFTVIELVMVSAVIALMAALAVPNVLAYVKNYEINKSAKEVASEINRARYRAIMKNANAGVLFVIVDNQSYIWAIQDDQDRQANRNPRPEQMGVDQLLAEDNQHGILQTLPFGVVFVAPAADQDPAFRYDRYGSWCDPGASACPALTGFAGTSYIENTIAGAVIRIRQTDTMLSRTLRVGPGGRVIVEQL